MKSKLLLALFILILVASLVFFIRNNQNKEVNTSNLNSNSVKVKNLIDNDYINSDKESIKNKVNINELSKHNTSSDCWIAYDNKVYDITSFLPRHLGTSERILPYCGTKDEFTDAFIKKHGTTKVEMLMKVGVFIGDFDVIGSLE
jgi:cytochrome b involved in lipid metabolism